jgi:MFS family permease
VAKTTDRTPVDEALVEPTIPRGVGIPPRLFTNRPFLWLVLGTGVGSLSFWSYFGAMWADASFSLHASPAQMSILLGAFSVPFVVLVPFQGLLVDRWSPKWMNLLGYVIGVIAMPVAWTATSLGQLYVSSFLVGMASAGAIPARSALTGLLVEERHLVQANGTISGATQLAIVFGPLYAGLVLRSHNTDPVYAIATVVGLLSLVLFAMVPDRRQGGDRPRMGLRDLADGFQTSWRFAELRLLLALYGAGWLLVNMLWILEPLFIKHTLHLKGDALQFMWVAHGVGAFTGAVFMSRLKRGVGRELPFIGAGMILAGVGFLLYFGVATYATGLIGSAIGGLGFAFFLVASLALIQRVAGEEKFGRVTSVFAVLQEGSGLVISLVIIALGSVLVVRPTLLTAGPLLCAGGALGLVALRRLERHAPADARGDGAGER